MVKINLRNRMAVIYLLGILLVIVHTISMPKEHPQQQAKTIVQRNRFYSAVSKMANYNISGIEKGRPLILILKSTFNLQHLIDEGLTISFQGGPDIIYCPFKKITDLCVVPTIPDDLKMIISCQALPCQVQWVIYQPQPKDPSSKQPALNLYNLQNTTQHLLGEITCNNPQIESFQKDVVIYSQTPYNRAYYNNVIYVLFTSFSHGFIYVDVAEESRSCAEINFINVPLKIKKNQDKVKDFITKTSPSPFSIEGSTQKDFSIECTAVRLDNYTSLRPMISVSLSAQKDGKLVQLVSQKIKSIARAKVNDFTLIFKAPGSEYSNLKLLFQVDNAQLYLLNFNLVVTQTFQIQLGQTVFFALKKDQKLQLKIQGDKDINEDKKYYLIEKRKEEIKLNNQSCSAKNGCDVELTALTDTENMVYVSSKEEQSTKLDEEGKGMFEFEEIEFISINKQIKHKIRLGDNIFLKKKIEKGKSYEINVNSPNLIIYAAAKSKCQVPSSHCRERTSNYHHPFVYQAKENDELLINIEGLENTQFELTIREDDSLIELSDGTAFSYTMDEQEDRIDFTFKLKEKTDVGFNLVAPLNALKLYVSNTIDPAKNLQTVEQSSDGFIQFKKDDIEGLSFTISVVKAKINEKYFSHFTLIASSTHSKQRLEPTITNYETLTPSKSKDFIFEFDRNEGYVCAFSVFNIKENINLQLLISKDGNWIKNTSVLLKKQTNFVDIEEASQDLCLEEGSFSCQLFMRVISKMDVEIDFSITLLTKNSVIQLKDGIWQSFPANYMITSSSFYFYPRHNNSNILIFYHSPMPKTRISYKLWRFDIDKINPVEWPFPFKVNPSEKLQQSFRSNHYISIGHQQLNKLCWPNCVVLLNIYMQQGEQSMPYSMYEYSFFKIMASNSQLELPQKQKISFSLGKLQDKEVLIDLKYILNKQKVIFYTTSTIGDCMIKANLYSSQQQTCPIQNQNSDFSIEWGEYQISVDKLKAVMNQKGMEEDKNIYLCAAIHSESSCKMTMQYTAEDDNFKQISMDTYEDIKLGQNQSKFYSLEGFVTLSAKVTRLSGFPFVNIKTCQKTVELRQCKQQFKDSTEKGKQIVVKTESLSQVDCSDCVILLKFSTIQPSSLSFHSQSKFSELELKEKETLSDFLNENENNKYQIHVNRGQDLIVNIHVQEGNLEAHLTNAKQVNLVKKSTNDQRVIQFHLKKLEGSADTADNRPEDDDQGLLNPLALAKTFQIYHLSISSINADKAASYTIGYSSGQRQFFLQDGLIVDYELQSKAPHSFYYCNSNVKQHVFYTLSAASPLILKQLVIKAFSFESFEDSESKKQIPYTKPNINKHTPNPTLVFDFPDSTCFEIKLTNPTLKTEHVSMGINHQEVIFLPFNHEYPFQLHKNEYLNVLSDVNNPGFIDMYVKKCDQSVPILKYTFDYQGFIKGQFLYEGELNEASSRFHIKANRIGTLYINVQAGDQPSLITIKLVYSQEKGKTPAISPGRHGQINYQFIDSKRANVSFEHVICNDCKNIKYTAYSSANEQDLYGQMICPNAFFQVLTANPRTPYHTEVVKATGQKVTPLNFVLTVQQGVEYVGIVAQLETGEEVYYRPVQIASLWGKWTQQTGFMQKVWIGLIILCILCVLMIWVRRASRKGYRPLDQVPE